MYRLLLICLLVNGISSHYRCCHHWDHGRQGSHSSDHDFHRLSWDVVSIDRKVQRLCNSQSDHLTETFLGNSYRLAVSLPGYSEENIKVTIRNRVLFLQAVNEKDVFSEIKILPDLVKTREAYWKFEEGLVTIQIPYKTPLGTEVVKVCGTTIDDTPFEVQKALPIDARFGAGTDLSLGETVV